MPTLRLCALGLLCLPFVLAACPEDPEPGPDSAVAARDAAPTDAGGSDSGAPQAPDAADAPAPDAAPFGLDAGLALDAGPEPCQEVNAFSPVFSSVIATWSAQDALGGWPDSPVVFAGSSSIRRWEGLARAYSDYSPLQRGVGGAQLGEIAYFAEQLVTRHAPRAVVIYAGTNDLHEGVAPAVVLDRFRCLRHRIGARLGWNRPVLFVALTPNPARWAEWPAQQTVNAAVARLAETDPGLVYVDVATPLLATGSPPDSSLYVSDGLHLTEKGYALWNSALRPAVEAATPPTPRAGAPSPYLARGTRILIDLGPSNAADGEETPSPDYLGQTWNNWPAVGGGGAVQPGEQFVGLRAADGGATGIDLVIAGGFVANGRSNGGLLWPDRALLGDLAVGSATGDSFQTADEDAPGALFLRGLDPGQTYTLRLFAARDDSEVRVTRYTVQGAASVTATLQTSGAGAGHAGGITTNDHAVAAVTAVQPDAWGHVFVDVAKERGSVAYLSALELVVE